MKKNTEKTNTAENKKQKKVQGFLKQAAKKQFASMQFKQGSYSAAVIAVVLVIVIFVNMIVGQLPKSLTEIDISSSLIYGTGETTQQVLSELDKDVDILVIAENDTVDTRIERFLERYAEQSSHISLSYRDPVLHPDVLTSYGVSTNTIIISCEDTGKETTVSISDMIQYDEYYLYYQGTKVESGFDGEGLMTSAIDYVAASDTNTIYLLSGHNEAALSSSVEDMLNKSNLTTASLNLMETSEVPEDCELLFINSPQVDLAVDELQAVRRYLRNGGNVMLFRGVTQQDLTNLDSLMEEYGLVMVNEYIGDMDRYYQAYASPYNFFPEITSSSLNVDSSSMILVSAVAGMEQAEEMPNGVSVESLLTTGNRAFAESDSSPDRQFILGAKSTKVYSGDEEEQEASDSILIQGDGEEFATENEEESSMDEEGNTEIETETEEEGSTETETETELETEIETEEGGAETELGTEEESNTEIETESETEEEIVETTGTLIALTVPSMIDAGITDLYQNLENLNEFMNLTASFFDDVENISIPAKSLEITYNTVTNTGVWNSLFLFVIPIFSIVCGLYVWLKRRKA